LAFTLTTKVTSYQQAEYIIEKFGEPAAAIISIGDYYLLQTVKQQVIATNQEATEPMSHKNYT
jgi:hypothetical protein